MAENDYSAPKTVFRPHRGAAAKSDPQLFLTLARPVFLLAESIARDPAPNANRLLTEARDVLDGFEKEAQRKGVAESSVAPARYALLVVLDSRARGNRAMPVKAWSAGAMAALFRGRDTNLDGLRKIRGQGANAGPEYADLVAFVDECIRMIDDIRAFKPAGKRSATGKWVIGTGAALLLVLAAWGGWVEWRYRNLLLAEMPDIAAMISGTASRALADILDNLARLDSAAAKVEAKSAGSPLGLIQYVNWIGPGQSARARYRQVADVRMPRPFAEAFEAALASEGSGIALYDTLRARSILSGEAAWNPYFLQGWLAARDGLIPGLARMAAHVHGLSGPVASLARPDAELMDLARAFAAEAPEAERAFLELARSSGAASVPQWIAAREIPGIEIVLVRRSGTGLGIGIPGLFTAAGWEWAQSSGADAALTTTRAEVERLKIANAMQSANVQVEVLEVLQRETIAQWNAFLADIRVRPFDDQPTAMLIAGTLGGTNSPLTVLLREAWVQVGGEDQARSFENQQKYTAAFGITIQFVGQGKMAGISQLFAALQVALKSLGADATIGSKRLMNVQARANSITTLNQAPALVTKIIEDVLAQTSASSQDLLDNQLNLLWQSQVYSVCGPMMANSYPFAEGPDMALADFADLVGTGGTLDRFFNRQLAESIDTTSSPWRWKPVATLSGFRPESAEFFQRVAALRAAFFSDADSARAQITLTALAERGSAEIAIGGAKVPVATTGAPGRLDWPGPVPETGIEVTFQTAAGPTRLAAPGHWGLLHLLDGMRLRERDDGLRYLIDLRSGDARLFAEMAFERTLNPVSVRKLMQGLACPASL